MRVLISLLALFLASTVALISPENKALSGNQLFSQNLYNVLALRPGNIFFSPFSAHAVLSMAYGGADDTTYEALTNVLGLVDKESAAVDYKNLIDSLNNVENVTLSVANKVYLQTGREIIPKYKDAVTKNFNSEVQQLNFSDNVNSVETINAWVKEKTNQKIEKLLQPSDLDESTRLVLVNAIYFKGNWRKPFPKFATRKEPFYLNDHDTVEVDMMHQTDFYNYKEDQELDAKVLEIPYQNPDFKMIIVLPNDKNGIKELEEKIKTRTVREVTKDLSGISVKITLPKFKLEQKINMKESLSKIGLEEIFDREKATFNSMIHLQPEERLCVDQVIQKAVIEVNEKGAEAAAATSITMIVPAMSSIHPINQVSFVADHPFIFLVEGPSGVPLFYGRYAKPQ